MAEATSFGANLRAAREAAKLTQQDVATKLGFSRTTGISLWERSEHLPEADTIIKLAAAIGCTPATLMAGVVTPYDRLRGYAVTVALDDVLRPPGSTAQGLSPVEARVIDHLRRLPAALVTRFAHLIEEAAHYANPQTARTTAPDARFRRGSPDTPAAAPRAGGTAARRARRAR